jgi:opacity protein-like surface antigen
MRTASAFLVIVLMLSSSSYLAGQEVQRPDTLSYAGRKAFAFSFNGFNLSGGLGGSIWLKNDYALQLLLGGSYSTGEDLTNNTNNYSTSVGITAYIKKHFHASRDLSPYIGFGIGISYYQVDGSYCNGPERSGIVRVPVVAGVEYWVTDNISLSGEQAIGFNFDVSKYSRHYGVSNSTSSLLLSVYF